MTTFVSNELIWLLKPFRVNALIYFDYLFKGNNGNTKTLRVQSYQQRHQKNVLDIVQVGLFVVNLEQISHIILVFPLSTLYKKMAARFAI